MEGLVQMYRKKQIIYIAHCVLNQNSVIRDWERAQGAFNDIIRVLLDENISIVQLPCPEFTFLGESRLPMTKEGYDVREYRNLCNKLAENIIDQMKEYIAQGYQLVGILGIEGSPTCDTLGEKGIFMEELQSLMNKDNIHLETFDIPENYEEGSGQKIIFQFKKFIDKAIKK